MKTMKIRSLFYGALCALAVTVGFASCGDDDPESPAPVVPTDEAKWDAIGNGKVEMTQARAYILNEGAYNSNNAGISYFDWTNDKLYSSDFYAAQNEQAAGDTGQDLVVDEDNNLYLVVYGSNYIAKLDSFGVEKQRVEVSAELGQPRYAVEDAGYLYVTCYGGYVAKYSTADLSLVGSVKVGANPEYIVKDGGKLYCTNSGWGEDNRVAVIDIKSFSQASFIEVMQNPDGILAVNGEIYVQGYGAYYDYPWGVLDNGKFVQIGTASKWTAFGDVIYLAYGETDWTTYETTTTFTSYNTATHTLNTESFLKDAPAELSSMSVYGISVNQYNGDIYILTSDFSTNGGVYHFKSDGSYVGKFTSTGVSPRKIVFLN
ncbi:MAG: hypothetical protein IJ710_07945 [Prevotella sp.]|nr:hypothetical protein [Prevotella sp.]